MNPVLVEVFGLVEIRWYSAILFLSFLIGGGLLIDESKKFNITENDIVNYFFLLIPFSIIGARLYYVLFNINVYSSNFMEIFMISKGGLAIHGGILAGLFYTLKFAKNKNISRLRFLDMAVVSLILGQAIGRWGNFFNQEAYGSTTTLDFLQSIHLPKVIIDGMFINNNYYHPTFLYESIWCLIGFVVLLILRRSKYLKIGVLTSVYLMWYSFGRFFIEALRTDSLMLANLKMAQLVSVTMFIFGILLYFWSKRGGVFDNLYNSIKKLSYDEIKLRKEITQMEMIKNQQEMIAKHAKTSTVSEEVPLEKPVIEEKTKEEDNTYKGDFKW